MSLQHSIPLHTLPPSDVAGTATLTVNGTPTETTGIHGHSAVQFDGVDDHIATDVVFAPPEGTVAFWMRPDNAAGTTPEYMVSVVQNDGLDYFTLQNWNDGSTYWGWTAGNVDNRVITTQAWPTGWFHVVFTWSSAEQFQRLYWDGTLIGATTACTVPTVTRTLAIATFDRVEGMRDWYAGQLSDLRIYDRAMTDAEVRRLYQSSSSGVLVASRTTAPEPIRPTLSTTHASNGETIRVHVIGSPGQASEERREVVLPATNATDLPLNWQAAHTDFRVELALASATPTATPTVNEVTLTE